MSDEPEEKVVKIKRLGSYHMPEHRAGWNHCLQMIYEALEEAGIKWEIEGYNEREKCGATHGRIER